MANQFVTIPLFEERLEKVTQAFELLFDCIDKPENNSVNTQAEIMRLRNLLHLSFYTIFGTSNSFTPSKKSVEATGKMLIFSEAFEQSFDFFRTFVDNQLDLDYKWNSKVYNNRPPSPLTLRDEDVGQDESDSDSSDSTMSSEKAVCTTPSSRKNITSVYCDGSLTRNKKFNSKSIPEKLPLKRNRNDDFLFK